MKRLLTRVGVAVIAFVLGAAGMYILKGEPKSGITSEWIPVKAQEFGVSWAIDMIKTDIPEPKTDLPSGKVKFLNRDRGIQLGYVLKLPIKTNPTSVLSAKYLKTTKSAGGLEIGPTRPSSLRWKLHVHAERCRWLRASGNTWAIRKCGCSLRQFCSGNDGGHDPMVCGRAHQDNPCPLHNGQLLSMQR
jgi:hypothetical protein